jgi:hypothetical protein
MSDEKESLEIIRNTCGKCEELEYYRGLIDRALSVLSDPDIANYNNKLTILRNLLEDALGR